jgi:hypothetical protein
MQVEVRRHIDVKWPSPIGENGHRVLKELVERLTVPWFLMGRTLLKLSQGSLDTEDSDIDIGIEATHESRVRFELADWPLAIETFYFGRTQQMMWFPDSVLVDCHVFRPAAAYVSQKGKWVARPAEQFTPSKLDGLPVPADRERFLFEDYGPDWRWKP